MQFSIDSPYSERFFLVIFLVVSNVEKKKASLQNQASLDRKGNKNKEASKQIKTNKKHG